MNATQAKAVHNKVKQIVRNFQCEDDNDQLFNRIHVKQDGDNMVVEVECRIENPDQGYETDWFWVDAFCVGPRGRVF